MRRRPAPCGGFTLIELLAVIAVAATLAVVAVPHWRSPGGVDRAARRMAHDLRAARSLALARGVAVLLPVTAAGYLDPFGDPIDLASSGVTLTVGAPLAFNGQGEPTGGTSAILTGPDGSRTLTLAPTGLVTP